MSIQKKAIISIISFMIVASVLIFSVSRIYAPESSQDSSNDTENRDSGLALFDKDLIAKYLSYSSYNEFLEADKKLFNARLEEGSSDCFGKVVEENCDRQEKMIQRLLNGSTRKGITGSRPEFLWDYDDQELEEFIGVEAFNEAIESNKETHQMFMSRRQELVDTYTQVRAERNDDLFNSLLRDIQKVTDDGNCRDIFKDPQTFRTFTNCDLSFGLNNIPLLKYLRGEEYKSKSDFERKIENTTVFEYIEQILFI